MKKPKKQKITTLTEPKFAKLELKNNSRTQEN